MESCPSDPGPCGQFPTIQVGVLALMISFNWLAVVLVELS